MISTRVVWGHSLVARPKWSISCSGAAARATLTAASCSSAASRVSKIAPRSPVPRPPQSPHVARSIERVPRVRAEAARPAPRRSRADRQRLPNVGARDEGGVARRNSRRVRARRGQTHDGRYFGRPALGRRRPGSNAPHPGAGGAAVKRLLFVGTYRDDGASPAHPLFKWFGQLFASRPSRSSPCRASRRRSSIA